MNIFNTVLPKNFIYEIMFYVLFNKILELIFKLFLTFYNFCVPLPSSRVSSPCIEYISCILVLNIVNIKVNNIK